MCNPLDQIAQFNRFLARPLSKGVSESMALLRVSFGTISCFRRLTGDSGANETHIHPAIKRGKHLGRIYALKLTFSIRPDAKCRGQKASRFA
jgi:hypothetical protein